MLKNYPKAGGFTINTPEIIVPELGTSEEFMITNLVVNNQNITSAGIKVEVVDGSSRVTIIEEASIAVKESLFFDLKIALTVGQKLEVTATQSNMHVLVSGDLSN